MKTTMQTDTSRASLDEYEQLLDLSKAMLKRSRNGQWDALLEDETRYVSEVVRMVERGTETFGDYELQARKSNIIEQILEQSVEIRRRLISRRDEISTMIKASKHQAHIRNAYSLGGTHGQMHTGV